MAMLKKLAYLAGGSYLVWNGLRRHNASGYAIAAAGGKLLLNGTRSVHDPDDIPVARDRYSHRMPYGEGFKIRTSIVINKPPQQLYRFWRDLENLPCFMTHLESVKRLDGTHSQWNANVFGAGKLAWEAEITADRPNEMIGWRSLKNATVHHAGSVRFEPARRGRATRLTVALQYNPPAGSVAVNLARLFGRDPERQIREDLERFKKFAESTDLEVLDRLLHKAA